METMVKIEKLKNNSSGRKVLQSLIGRDEPLDWLTGILPTLTEKETGESWKHLLLDYEEELKTLLQHFDPVIRLPACTILLCSESSVTRRLLWEIFSDCHQSLRTVMVRRFKSDDRQKLYNTLFRIYLRDPVFSVRQESLLRIKKDFADLYSLNPENLKREEKIHCIELFSIPSAHDHSLAMRFMEETDPGIVLAASLYLEKTGTLDKLIRGASGRDPEDLDRRLRILKTAATHQVSSFLNRKENFGSKGSLSLAVNLLQSGIQSTRFSWLIAKVFAASGQSEFTRSLKENALDCLLKSGNPESFTLIGEMLEDSSVPVKYRERLLENLPAEGADQFYPALYRFLQDPGFTLFPSLLKAFETIPLTLCLSDLFSLIRSGSLDREIRKRAFILLSRYRDFTSILFLIENLSLLSIDEMETLGRDVFRHNKASFLTSADIIFHEQDSSLHQKLMHLCSLSGIDDFIPVMEEKLTASDPESRIRAVWSLRTLNAVHLIPSILPLLYDPVEFVRSRTASALIDWDREETFDSLIKILNDRTESISVQQAIAGSLGRSSGMRSIEILVSLLESNPDLEDIVLKALQFKDSESAIRLLVELYESVSARVKSVLNTLFRDFGEKAEPLLMDLLSETKDLQTRHNICTILDSTGYVETLVGGLKSSSAAKRMDAAEKLSIIGTLKASRGLLYGARDINKNIRILSIRALVRIHKNTEVLSELENDPDKKVRRYAAWAKERIKAELLP